MNKFLIFGASFLALTSLAGCSNKTENSENDKPLNPDDQIVKYDTPSKEYKDTYNDIKTLTFDIGDVSEGIVEWQFYTYPVDKEYTKVYYCSFALIEDALCGLCYFEENNVETKSILIEFPSFDIYLKDKMYFAIMNQELGEESLGGYLNPRTYTKDNSVLTFEENKIQDTTNLLADSIELLNYLLDTMIEYTSFSVANLGFETYTK